MNRRRLVGPLHHHASLERRLEAVFGPVLAWNLLLLATVVAGGLLAYAWLRALVHVPPPKHGLAGFEALNTWYYADASRSM